MEAALLSIWYDLEQDHEEQYLAWLHNLCLPELQARAGCAWVAHYRNVASDHMRDMPVTKLSARSAPDGAGSQYALLIGGTSLATLLSTGLLGDGGPTMALAQDIRAKIRSPQSALFSIGPHVNGPAACVRTEGTTPPACVQMGMLRMKSVASEQDLLRWYFHTRLPLMTRMEGVIGARLLSCVAGWAKYGVLYEFESLEARNAGFEPQELAIGNVLSGRDTKTRLAAEEYANPIPIDQLIHPPGSPIVGVRIWPPLS